MLLECRLPAVEEGSAYARLSAGSADVHSLLGMLRDHQLALDLAIFPGVRRHPPSPMEL